MARLVNELSWSRSRVSMLETCPRQYYYQYYQKWGGWSWDADEEAKRAYFFSKMTNLPMLCGNAVHETIKVVLEGLRDEGRVTLEDPADHVRRALLSRTWQEAEQELWRRDLKRHPPIFELYYEGCRPDPEKLKEVGAKAARCVENFLASALFRDLSKDDPERWLAVDDGPSFDDESKVRLDGRTIWALPDFARRTAGGDCEIWDWKTGKPNPHDRLQLMAYALHAHEKWGFDPERIRLFGFYLADRKEVEYPCDPGALEEIKERVRTDFARMERLLADPDDNRPLPRDEAFPMIEDLETCRRCLFKELCGR